MATPCELLGGGGGVCAKEFLAVVAVADEKDNGRG